VRLLANLFPVRWLVRAAERILDRIPLVKSVFQGLKDVARYIFVAFKKVHEPCSIEQ